MNAMIKLKILFLMISFFCFFSVINSVAQDCNYWNAAVGEKSSNGKRGNKDEKNTDNILEGIECLLRLEGDKSRGAYSGATHNRVSQLFPQATVEVNALYYVSKLFFDRFDHANGIALQNIKDRTFNSEESVRAAFESYRKWFIKVKKIGLEEARKQKLDPLECSGIQWY